MREGITGLTSMATRALLAVLGADHEVRTGQAVAFRALGGVEVARRVRAGEVVDVVLLAANVMAALEREGHLHPGSRVDVVRSHVALAVPDGAPRPDIASEAALRDAVLAAPAIYHSTGPSGDQLKAMLARWGIAARVAERLVQAPPGIPVGTLLAQGRSGIGVQQVSELSGIPGITVAGTLPPALGMSTVFTAGIGARAHAPDAARAFITALAAPEAADAKRRAGFDAV